MEGEVGVEEGVMREGVMREGVEPPFLPTLGLLTLMPAEHVASQSI